MSDKKVIRGWAFYDWANSAYNLVITSTIFPTYYDAITTTQVNGIESHKVNFLGSQLESGALYNYAIALAYLIIALLSPILTSIADFRGNKKRFMQFFCYLGGFACCGLYFFTASHLAMGLIFCILAAIGYCGSLVFYNSYLPDIATKDEQDKVSAKGYAYGYIGSVILQIFCLLLVQFHPFGIDGGLAARISFLLVGLWWIIFAQITFSVLPNSKTNTITQKIGSGFEVLKNVWQQVKALPVLRNFLFGFFFYSMGVQTVMIAAALYGSQVLNVPTSNLIIAILLIQVVAIGGAYIMAELSKKFGNINVLFINIFIWIGICIIAYYINSVNGFYLVAVLVGLVMGGIQSLSRSTYAKLMPTTTETASFFSFYDVTEKIAIVIGIFVFGLINQLTGDMRQSVISLIIFFLISIIGLVITKKKLRISKNQG